MNPDFRPAIRRALNRECKTDFLNIFKPAFTSRAVFGRLATLIAMLRAGESVNCRKFAKAAGVCKKTAFRDFDYLRSIGVRLSFDKKDLTYRLDPFQPVPFWHELIKTNQGVSK